MNGCMNEEIALPGKGKQLVITHGIVLLLIIFAGKGGVGPGGIAAIVIGVLAAIILIVIIVILVLQRRNGATPLIAKFPSFANPAYSRNTDTVEMSQGSNFENPMFGKQN